MGLYVDSSVAERDVGRETRDTLQAQIDLAPDQSAAYASTLPLYTAVNNQAAYDALLGTKGGPREEQYVEMEATPESRLDYSTALQQGFVRNLGDSRNPRYELTAAGQEAGYTAPLYGGSGIYRAAATTPTLKTRTITGVDSPGLLSLYENDIAPALNRVQSEAQRQQVEQNQALLLKYGPGYIAALKSVNPEQTALRDMLYAQAKDELGQGGQLDAGTLREIEQSTQGRWNSALAYSPEVAVQTRMNTGSAAEARRRQRQDSAMRMIGLDQSLYGDQFMQITGRQSGTTAAAQNFLYQGQGTTAGNQAATRGQFDPFNSYASNLYGQNSTNAMKAEMENSQTMGGLIGGGLNVFGSAMGAAGKTGVSGFGRLFGS